MKDLLSPGSLVTMAGGVLTVVGAVAYGTGNANLSLPTISVSYTHLTLPTNREV